MLKKNLLTQTLFLIKVFPTQAQNNQDLINYIESKKKRWKLSLSFLFRR